MAKILVVDDDPDVRALVARRLAGQSHRVVATASADEALDVVRTRGAPDLAILDVAMPGTTGLELLDQLREEEGMEQLPAIFLSARVRESDIEQGRRRGAIYLTKPFVASALLSAVDRVLSTDPGEATVAGW